MLHRIEVHIKVSANITNDSRTYPNVVKTGTRRGILVPDCSLASLMATRKRLLRSRASMLALGHVIRADVVATNEQVAAFMAKTKDQINQQLQKKQPVMVGVNNQGWGHYVVLTGIARYQGVDTWLIHDPLSTEITTLAQKYNNRYYTTRVFNGAVAAQQPATPQRHLYITVPTKRSSLASRTTIQAASDDSFLVTDQLGRATGYDNAAGVERSEIPGGIYSRDFLTAWGDDGNAIGGNTWVAFDLSEPQEGNYNLLFAGVGVPVRIDLVGDDGTVTTTMLDPQRQFNGRVEYNLSVSAGQTPTLTVTPTQQFVFLPTALR